MNRLLGAGASLPQFVADLITQQALMVAGTEAAAFAIEPSQDPESPFNLRPIALLAVGCVVFTTVAVAFAAHWLLHLPLPVGFVPGGGTNVLPRDLGLPRDPVLAAGRIADAVTAGRSASIRWSRRKPPWPRRNTPSRPG